MIDASSTGLIAIGAGLAVGITGIAAGGAEGAIGSVAIRKISRNEKFFGKGLLMTVIPESIAVFGLVVALIMLFVF